MQLTQLLTALPDAVVHGTTADIDIRSIEYDSRKTGPETGFGVHSIFVCMPGARLDGHDYAPAMYEKGCRCFLCAHRMDLPADSVQIVVETPRLALAKLSAAFYGYPAREMTIIGITGTKGKTTTAILLSGILSENGIPCAYIGSNGIDIGPDHYETVNTTPESRELQKYFRMMLDAGYRHVVMEVSSQALHTYRIHGLEFDACLFTNLGEDHISPSEHPSFEDYRDCKRRLFFEYPCRHIVTNPDDPHWQTVSGNPDVHTLTYAIDTRTLPDTGAPVDFTASNIRPFRSETALGIEFDCVLPGESTSARIPVRLRTPGDFSVYNGLCAMAAASLYGISPEQSAGTLYHMSIRGRFEIVDALDGVTFLVDYAHNGMSLENALTELRRYRPHRLICVFGSIGGRAQNRRRELAEVSSRLADISIITSDNPDNEPPEEIIRDILSWFDRSRPHYVIPDREAAVRAAVQMAQPGDIVLFAGKGHETYQIVNGIKEPFSEKAILLDEAALVQEKAVL
ncbi:MAG: UDP-N-acetylmuramoyl-L-alanyl-D-glutamate--2,6-diaminopimelate ligase [Clostridia bacterium]|nr:UDP-N-acetylmuramoyl-L-alanyl-D-glutamate--2,6-diaminopimelate ligase [Clostridia bacterium]